jgi:hypothetical protein
MVERLMFRFLTAFVIVVGCGGNKADEKKVKDDAAPGPTVAPIATPTIGVDGIKRMNYRYGDTYKEYGRLLVACCTKNKPADWAATRTHAEAVLAKDSQNVGAHWLLGVALAKNGDHAAAVDHLVHAIAGDYARYGIDLAKETELEAFLVTKHGTAVKELAAKIRDDYRKRAASGLLVVGRRADFRWPEKPGTQNASTRGELYAYDRETRRYLRLTHTNDSVAGFVRSPSGTEIAVLGFDKLDRPKADKTDKADDAPPIIMRAYVFTLDTAEWKQGPRATIAGPAREVSVGYGAGDQLLVSAAPANGRWATGAPTVSSIDRTTGKLTKVATPMSAPRIVFSLEEGRVVRFPANVTATWAGDPPTAASIAVNGKLIAIPESGATTQTSVAVGPAHVAFATTVDPCSDQSAPSLYVAELKTGALKHLLTAKSRFSTRWIDDLLAYEDGDGAIRVWDARLGRESFKLENKSGLALDVLSLAPAPLCKQAPPKADAGSGSADEPMPPEEGPVVAPN